MPRKQPSARTRGLTALLSLAKLALPAAGAVLVGTFACGPSFQAVYECDVRFEHCYALDMEQVTPLAQRACWSEWLKGYTFSESRDRIEYANSRVRDLAEGSSAFVADAGPQIAVNGPSTPFQPPPHLMLSDGSFSDSGGDEYPGSPMPLPPASACVASCADDYAVCRRDCPDGGCLSCDRNYTKCVPRCFRDAGQAFTPSLR